MFLARILAPSTSTMAPCFAPPRESKEELERLLMNNSSVAHSRNIRVPPGMRALPLWTLYAAPAYLPSEVEGATMILAWSNEASWWGIRRRRHLW